jgi:predicted nucleotidyltransferase
MSKKVLPELNVEKIKPALKELSGCFPQVIAAYLFGSYAGGRPTPLSDVDIGILLVNNLSDMESFKIEMHLLGKLQKILGTNNIDLVVLNKAPLPIQYHATCGILFFSTNEEKRTGFVEYVRKYYIDCLPIYREYKEEFLKRVKEGCGQGGEFPKDRQTTPDA